MIWWDCACCDQLVYDPRRDCIGDGIILVCPICNGETIVRLEGEEMSKDENTITIKFSKSNPDIPIVEKRASEIAQYEKLKQKYGS
jgi:hypothetical protein